MMINRVPRLTCAAFLKEYYPRKIRVEPLDGFPVERDLVTDMDMFVSKLTDVSPWIIRNEGEEKPVEEGTYLQSPGELAEYKQYSMCINLSLIHI